MIRALQVKPREGLRFWLRFSDVIWTGSDNSPVHVTRDGGESWKNVTPPDMPDLGRVSLIDA